MFNVMSITANFQAVFVVNFDSRESHVRCEPAIRFHGCVFYQYSLATELKMRRGVIQIPRFCHAFNVSNMRVVL